MAKKSYTEMVTWVKSEAKRLGVGPGDVSDRLRALSGADPSDKDLAAQFHRSELELDFLNGAVLHLFLPGKEFCHWLADCAKTLDGDLANRVTDGLGGLKLGLHFPTEAKIPSVLLQLFPKRQDGGRQWASVLAAVSAVPGYGHTHALVLRGQTPEECLKSIQVVEDSAFRPGEERTTGASCDMAAVQGYAVWLARLIAGLGLYMSCFPEQITDGIPRGLKHDRLYRGVQSKTIGISEKIISRDGPCPHYRSGHFVLLSSNRYVNKKGQVVFRHGCFVKGKAKTVLGTDAAEG